MIQKTAISFIAVLIVCILSLLTVLAWSAETIIRSNGQYTTYIDDENNLAVYDLEKKQSFKLSVGCEIRDIEICPNYPFISFACIKENHKAYFLYDLEKRKVYEGQFYLDLSEHRWAPSGEYTYFNKETSFRIVRTKHLRDYLQKSKQGQSYIEIMGHPLGAIYQTAWIGDNLLYGTGVGEMECWGFLDLAKMQNNLVSCCGIAKDNPCSKKIRQDNSVIKLFIEQVGKSALKPISTDLYRDALRIELSDR